MKCWQKIAVLVLCGLAPTVMAPTGGLPSSPKFKTVTISGSGNRLLSLDTTSSGGTYIAWKRAGTDKMFMGNAASIIGGGVQDEQVISSASTLPLLLATNQLERIRISGAGN